MRYLNFLALTILIALPLKSISQEKLIPANILFYNGDSIKGYLKIPYIADYDYVQLYQSENAKKPENIDMHTIRMMTLWSKADTAELVCARARFKKRLAERSIWRRVVFKCSNLWLFVSFGGVDLDENEKFTSGYVSQHLKNDGGVYTLYIKTYSIIKKEEIFKNDKIETQYLLRVGDENTPFIGSNSAIRKTSRFYFKDCPNLIERINRKEFKANLEDIEKMIEAYVKTSRNQ